MTRDEILDALAQDQEVTRTKIEDILQALADLCATELENGRPFHFGEIGFLTARPPLPSLRDNRRAMLIFRSTEAFRTRIGLTGKAPKQRGVHICKTCGLAPRKVRVYDECDSCLPEDGES